MLKNTFFTLLILFTLAIGYTPDGWWKFIPSTILIVGSTLLFYRRDWANLLGLKVHPIWAPFGIGLCFVFYLISYWLIQIELKRQGYHLVYGDFLDYVVVPFQTLNEELVFRALLLTALIKSGMKRWQSMLIPALIFAAFHWIFYSFNLKLENRGTLEISALTTLFFFGIATNSFFIKTGNIAIPWALHCGWNLNRLGSHITSQVNPSSERLPEFMTFNLLEGTKSVLFLSFLLASISCLCLFSTKETISKRC